MTEMILITFLFLSIMINLYFVKNHNFYKKSLDNNYVDFHIKNNRVLCDMSVYELNNIQANIANALDVANWFIITSSKEEDYTDMTNMKVNKMCYYAFCLYYKRTQHKLFNEKIEAWKHGPVIEEVYNAFSCCGRNEIISNKDY